MDRINGAGELLILDKERVATKITREMVKDE